MPFFQNLFAEEFEGNLVLDDRQYSIKFVVRGNSGRSSDIVLSYQDGPYNLSSSNGNLTISFCFYNSKNWAKISVDLTSAANDINSVKPSEVLNALNNNSRFLELFSAGMNDNNKVFIKQKKPITQFKFYIENEKAEQLLKFNYHAGINEIPSYFARHTIANRYIFEDSAAMLIALNYEEQPDRNIITNAVDINNINLNFVYPKEDWELFAGKSEVFAFTIGPSKNAVALIEEVTTYGSGSKVGDLSKKTITKKDSSGVIVSKFDIPYTLTLSDVLRPFEIYREVASGGSRLSGTRIDALASSNIATGGARLSGTSV